MPRDGIEPSLKDFQSNALPLSYRVISLFYIAGVGFEPTSSDHESDNLPISRPYCLSSILL